MPSGGYIIGVATLAKRRRSSQAVELEYDRIAHRYEHRWAQYVQATVSKTLAHLDLQPTMRLLDIGCGTGVMLRQAERACRIWDRVLRVINPAHQQIYSQDRFHALLSEHGYRVRVLELYKVSWLWGMMTASAVPAQPKEG